MITCRKCLEESEISATADIRITYIKLDKKHEDDLCWEHAMRIIINFMHWPDYYKSITIENLWKEEG
jgi:uncharacterized metal-binding protein